VNYGGRYGICSVWMFDILDIVVDVMTYRIFCLILNFASLEIRNIAVTDISLSSSP